jgi:hypothetical protein
MAKIEKKQKDKIITQILSLIEIGKSVGLSSRKSGINPDTFWTWVKNDSVLADRYARSKQKGLEVLADEIIEISDNGQNDTYIDENGNERTDNDAIQRSKLRVDSRKWILSKLLPKKYGEKMTQEIQIDKPVIVDDIIYKGKDK